MARAISVIRRLIDVRLKWWSKLPNGEPPDDCYSSVTPFSSLVTPSFYVVCSLESTEHQFLAIPEQVSELAGTFGLDKFLSTSNMVCEIQMHWKLSEHRARDLADQNEELCHIGDLVWNLRRSEERRVGKECRN